MKRNIATCVMAALSLAVLWIGGALPAIAGTSVWTPVGPGGTIVDLAIDPQTPSTLYAVGNGLVKSVDGGGRWLNIGAPLSLYGVSKVVIDPITPGTLYAATGINGVYKSVDAGGSWQPAGSGLTGSLKIDSLAIDPQTPLTLYAGIDAGGLFKSVDGGGSWTRADSGLSTFQPACGYCRNVVSLAIDPMTPAIVYAGTQSGAIFKSTDAGGTWSLRGSFPQFGSILSFVVDSRAPGTVYANTFCGGIFKSIDAGASWNPTGLNQAGCSGEFVVDLVGDPGTTSTLYALKRVSPGETALLESTDGAATWSPGTRQSFKMTALAIDPRVGTTFYAGLWQEGIVKSTDAGGTWSAANSGLVPLGLTHLAVDPAAPATMYGITLERPFKTTDGGESWRPVGAGLHSSDVMRLVMDPKTPTTLFLTGRFSSSIYKSADAAETWRPVYTAGYNDDFVALIIDPQAPTTVYAALSSFIEHHGSLYKSVDGGETWRYIWTGEGLNVLSMDRSDPATLYVMDWRGRTFKTTDGGSAWISSSWPSSLPAMLAADPLTPATLYGWNHGLYKSTDAGATWSATGAGLPDLGVSGLFIDPVTTTTLYLTSYDGGVFKSVDGGAGWAEFNDGLTGKDARSVSYLIFDPRTPGTIQAQTSAGIFIISPPTRVLDPTLDLASPERKGSGAIHWRTDQERDLQGFNVVSIDDTGARAQINSTLIPCRACTTGAGGDYTFIVLKHRSGRGFFVEEVYRDDHVERFGLTRTR